MNHISELPGCGRIQVGGLAVFLHWSVPLVGLGAGLFVATTVKSAGLMEFFATIFAVVVVILVHELGHAGIGKLLGLNVSAIILHGIGGMCLFERLPDRLSSRLLVLAGGVISQTVLLATTLLASRMYVGPAPLPLACTAFVFILFNGFLILASLFPYGISNGAQILAAIREAWQRRRTAT